MYAHFKIRLSGRFWYPFFVLVQYSRPTNKACYYRIKSVLYYPINNFIVYQH